ncbi:MAG: serine/threonine-protein kinase [Gemmataceae bacterium]
MAIETAKSIGNYDLLEKVAEGGMGAIYRGRHRESGMIVAIKIMPPHMARNPVLLKRFEQEFRAASRLDHPNIVRALDYSDNGNMPYLVMEFVEGESLGQKLEREGRMSESDAIRIIAQVAQGLHRAHKQNLVHRDVKPDNVLVTPEGVAKLADLGLVKETETDLNLTRTGRGLGTPHFMAPEQFRNAKNADIRCDIYSLGATLYQMVTGELPFCSNGPLDAWMKKIQNELVPPRQIVPALSERAEWAIRRAMSADPEKRPTSCREFIEDLTGHSTRRLPSVDSSTPQQELWYLVYKDETGAAHTVKGTMSAVRRSLKDGLLGDASNVRASRSKAGPFEPLRGHPEFRDLVIEAAPLTVPQAPSSRQAIAPPADTVPMNQRIKQEAERPIITPTASRKPHISLNDIPPSSSAEALKWLFLFVLFVVTAAVAFWFFG